MSFEYTLDARGLARLERRFAELGAKVPQEIQRTVSSVRRAARTESVRAVTGVYRIGQKYVRSALRVEIKGPLGFTVRGNNRPIPAHHYNGRALKRGGVAVTYERGKRVVIKDGFAGTPPQGGGDKLWRRTGQEKRRASKGRYALRKALREPIDVIVGPSVADQLLNKSVRGRINKAVADRMEREVTRRITLLIARGKNRT